MLELAVARELYERYPDFAEGQLAKIRSHVVSRASCAVVARELGLGERMAAARGSVPQDELTRLSGNHNVLAALLEAALGALFLEDGFEKIEDAVVAAFAARIEYARTTYVDHKTELQEALARLGRSVTYSVLDVDGPPHDRTFTCAAVDRRRGGRRRQGAVEEGGRAGSSPRGARESGLRHPVALGPADVLGAVQTSCRVHLRAIKLRGFKSFPEPVEVRLERGVAVVVGPNGSGKSNISDALLWAAGSLAPSELRAEKPDDVLFAGGKDRAPADYCEVELLFDNEDGALAELPFAEVSFMRRLHRGGEGQYLVNRSPVRRTDLVELLADVGLGGSMGSIISQGRVEEILGSKPEERRQLVEEAAGLGRFKRRRHRAELKLARVAIDVERARDLEAEVKKRLRPLALQATAAERAEKLRGEIGAVRARIAQLELAGVEERRTSAEERREAATLARNRTAKELEALLGERDRVEGELVGAAGGREEATVARYRLKSAAERLEHRRESAQALAEGFEPILRRFVRPSGSACSKKPGSGGSVSERSNARSPSSRDCRRRRGRSRSVERRSSYRRSTSIRATSGPSPLLSVGARGGRRGRRADGARLPRAGPCGRAREPRRRDRRRHAGNADRREGRAAQVDRALVTREGFAFDPARGELWYAGEAAEAVLLELEARRRSLEAEIVELDAAAERAATQAPATDPRPAELAERLPRP